MTASVLAIFTYLLFLSLTTANQTLDRLRKELHEAFRRWIPIRRHTKEELESLKRNLMLRKPKRVATWTAVGAGLGGILAAPLTFGASLAVTTAAAGIGAALGARTSNLTIEEEQKYRLSQVQMAIDSDRRACAELQQLLDSLNRAFTSATSAGATLGSMDFTLASPFADVSVLPRDITQLVRSSLDQNQGSTDPIVEEIGRILNNLKCLDEAEIQHLV